MPTYDYICGSCGQGFEQFHAITAKPLRKCPKCGKVSLKRLIGSGAGIIFKGSGFYQTDYRSESYKKGEKSEKSTTETVTAKTKTESKNSEPSRETTSTQKNRKKA
jgi:putative FmdB family regulatory protein